jgi:hypothetical protein
MTRAIERSRRHHTDVRGGRRPGGPEEPAPRRPPRIEQWLQRHPEAGSSWPSWPKASHTQGHGPEETTPRRPPQASERVGGLTGVPRSLETTPPQDPTVALCLGTCGDPGGVGILSLYR